MQQCTAWLQICGCSAEKEAEIRAELIAAGIAFAQRDDCRFGVVCLVSRTRRCFRCFNLPSASLAGFWRLRPIL